MNRRRVVVCLAATALWVSGCAAPAPGEGGGSHSEAFRIEPPRPDAARRAAGADGGAAPSGGLAAPADETLVASLAQQVDLASVLRLTAARNPRIAAARARWKAAIEKHPQAISLPDPMVELAVHYEEDRRGPQEWEYSFRQGIPFPTKILLEGDRADREAAIERQRYEAVIRDELVEVQEAFHELAYLARAGETMARVEDLMQRYAAFAAGELARGGGTLPESFRAEAQRAQLQYDRILVRELEETERARLRSLAGLRPGHALGVVAAPPFRPVRSRLPDLYALAESHNQELKAAGLSIDLALVEVDLARQSRIPDLELMVEWSAPDSGEEHDRWKALVGFNLPVWEHRNAARVRQAHALREAAAADRRSELARVEAAVARLHFRLHNMERLVVLYRDTLVPHALQAMNSAEDLHRSGRASLAAVLETAAAWYNFQLAHQRAVADHAQALVRLEQVLGTTVERMPNPPSSAPEGESDPEGKGPGASAGNGSEGSR